MDGEKGDKEREWRAITVKAGILSVCWLPWGGVEKLWIKRCVDDEVKQKLVEEMSKIITESKHWDILQVSRLPLCLIYISL